jgi:threonine dehydratase
MTQPATLPVTARDIRAAAARLAGQVIDTPCLRSRTLSEVAGCEVFLKFENLQFTSSFKERGALNRLLQLNDSARAHPNTSRPARQRACGGAGRVRRHLVT